jgi:hypothetical protein
MNKFLINCLLRRYLNSILETSGRYGEQVPSGDPAEWSCQQVYEFVRAMTNEEIAEKFKTEELDGMALSFITDSHLMQTMQLKLGPALKIMGIFADLRKEFAK